MARASASAATAAAVAGRADTCVGARSPRGLLLGNPALLTAYSQSSSSVPCKERASGYSLSEAPLGVFRSGGRGKVAAARAAAAAAESCGARQLVRRSLHVAFCWTPPRGAGGLVSKSIFPEILRSGERYYARYMEAGAGGAWRGGAKNGVQTFVLHVPSTAYVVISNSPDFL